MVSLLARFFIKDCDNVSSPPVRTAYGMLCGFVGILLNIMLFAGKLAAGLISGSIAITADAFNNLSDAGSSVITLIGFKLAGQRPDPGHPYGHGRLEYVSGLVVSLIIVMMGFELGKGSIEKIFSPEPVEFSLFAFAALAVSIMVKIYMYIYNSAIAKRIDSSAMRATALDSLSDTIATSVVLICSGIEQFTDVNIDAFAGVGVAIFICFAGIKAAKDTIDLILGAPPDSEFVRRIQDMVMAHPEVIGVHDLMVHNYGPGRVMISLHAEIPSDSDMMTAHDAIDNIERELHDTTGCVATIHMDPVNSNDELTNETRKKVQELIQTLDESLTMHDFRMVSGPTHTNVIFDIVVPFGFPMSDKEITRRVSELIATLDGNYFAVVDVDKSYI